MKDGKEVVVTWKSPNVVHGNIFYTDSNALEMQRRELGKRPTFNVTTNEKHSSNFYPVNSAITVVNETTNLQLTVMNDRS